MANKRKLAQHISRVVGTQGLADKAKELRENGYIPLSPDLPNAFGHEPRATVDLHDYIGAQLTPADGGGRGSAQRNVVPLLFASSGEQVTVSDDIGTKGLGYISWGLGNRVPNIIALLTNLIPFTAAGWKFNTDLASGMGPVPMYHYVEVSNGQLMERDIPYESAGELLKDRIKRLEKEVSEETGDNAAVDPIETIKTSLVNNQEDKEKSMAEQQLDDARKDLEIWKDTNVKVKDFVQRNNLNLVYTQLFGDLIMFGICFPEIQLQQTYIDPSTNKAVTGANWHPQITGLGYRMAHVCRLEKKDSEGKINYVYINNRWLDTPTITVSGGENMNEMSALPALNIYSPYQDLNNQIINARQSKLGKSARPTRFILPCFYPTVGRPYYPVPAWWSIYGGDIYEYAATLVHDRLQAKKNSNVIGRVIYVHQTYLDGLYTEQGADTPAKKAEWRNKFYTQVNAFLAGRANKGKSLLGFTFLDANGNEHKSFEVVELQDTNKSTAEANKTELYEISSIIAYSMGLDEKLIGNEPGNTSSSSGTDLRERYLLKQIQMSATQQLALKPMEVISAYNGWDEHLRWPIRREVMTTLDNSKTGVTTAKDNSEQ